MLTTLFLITILYLGTFTNSKECENCVCDCDWTQNGDLCDPNFTDETCCYECCCRDTRPIVQQFTDCDCLCTLPTPTPSSTQPPTSSSPTLPIYCPQREDLMGYQTFDQGWRFDGSGGAGTKAAFNLIGGSIEYDVDVSGVNAGVNVNVYSISPAWFPESGYSREYYCDAQRSGDSWCVENDFLEANGKCGGATTLHTIRGPGEGCTAWGCNFDYTFGKTSFSMRVEFDEQGRMTTFVDGVRYEFSDLRGQKPSDWEMVRETYSTRGAVIYSSQWSGWVPTFGSCQSRNGNTQGSRYEVSNLRIQGSVVRGPIPSLC